MNNKTFTDKVLKYTVIFEPDEKSGYVASVPSLPGCFTQGETFEEAKKMIQDAISGYLFVLQDEGLAIPTERAEPMITQISVPFSFQVAI